MRTRGLGLVALCVAVTGVACTRKSFFTATSDKSNVTVELYCIDGVIDSYGVNPYTSGISDRTKKFTWTLTSASNVVEARIVPKGTNPWPFNGNPDPLKPGGKTKSKDLVPNIPPGTYRYSIEVVCPNGSRPDTTITVDPDMIIPKTRPSDTQ